MQQIMEFIEKVITLAYQYRELLLLGVTRTLLLGIVGTLAGLAIGLVVGAIRAICQKKEPNETKLIHWIKKIIDGIMSIYITVFRGTPMMVQAMIIYFAVYGAGFHWQPTNAGLVIISINTGAYMSEILRAGIQSIDAGQDEAARSIGMSGWQSMRYIILPQAIRNAFPSIGNELIVNIKDCCTLSVIMITELFYQTKAMAGSTYQTVACYTIAAIIYLILTSVAAWIMKKLEKKINHTESNYFESVTVVKE